MSQPYYEEAGAGIWLGGVGGGGGGGGGIPSSVVA